MTSLMSGYRTLRDQRIVQAHSNRVQIGESWMVARPLGFKGWGSKLVHWWKVQRKCDHHVHIDYIDEEFEFCCLCGRAWRTWRDG